MRDVLGLFDFTAQRKGETVVPPDIERLDFARLLIVFEICERELLSRQMLSEGQEVGSEFEHSPIPKHKGALMVEMFNSVFGKVARYNRVERTEDVIELPQAQEIPSPAVVWSWKGCYAIAHKLWINLGKKYRRVTGRKIDLHTPNSVNLEQVARDAEGSIEHVPY